MGITRIAVTGLLATLALSAHAGEPPQVVQSRSPLAPAAEPLPDMQQLQLEWGHARVAQEAARVVASSPDLITASRALWDARLSEVTFPVQVRGEPAAWFEVVSPLQEVDVSEAGLRALWGTFPVAIVERDRMALACLDEAGGEVPVDLVLGGPEEVLPTDSSVLYTIDNVDDCWTEGGATLLVYEAGTDPMAGAGHLDGSMAAWAGRHARSLSPGMKSLSAYGEGSHLGGVTDVFGSGSAAEFDGLFASLTDCSTAGPCPTSVECPPPATCSCDERGSVVTRDTDGNGCPDQRSRYTYDDGGRITASEHDWSNDGVYDERCRYTEPCEVGAEGCKRSCAKLMGK